MRALEKRVKKVDPTPDFYEKHWTWLVRACQQLTGERQAAEDIAQETFLRAMTGWHILAPLDDRGRRAWLRRTARNIFIDQRRRDRRADAGVPEEPFLEDFTRPEVWAAVGDLPREERDIFALRYFAGYDSTEIGKMFGLPASTVRSRLRKARETLKKSYFKE